MTRSGATRALGQRRSARLVLVAAWVAFWLNTALFPCCEALAAALVGHSDIPSQLAIGKGPPHDSGETHAAHVHHNQSIPCKTNVKSVSAISGTYALMPADHFHPVLLLSEGFVVADLRPLDHSAIRAPRNYHPPPPFRLYLQTQRLLI